MMAEITADSLIRVGGSRWQKKGLDRVYFNGLATWYGLRTERYNSGNVCSATLDGESISNGQARRILSACDFLRLWFDVVDGHFYCEPTEYTSYGARIKECILAAVAALPVESAA